MLNFLTFILLLTKLIFLHAPNSETLSSNEIGEHDMYEIVDNSEFQFGVEEDADEQEIEHTDIFDPNRSTVERKASRKQRDFGDGRMDEPVVQTRHGYLMGVTLPAEPNAHQPTYQEVDLFSGVPYALSPQGIRRFKAPEPLRTGAHWNRRAAVKRAPSCIQPIHRRLNSLGYVGTENCLVLNIWRPEIARAQNAKIPVMVYFLDGNQIRGHLAVRKGMKLAAVQDVIVVNVMFRLGSLGHFAAEALVTPEGSKFAGSVGNWGMLDQVVALQWIQDNIEAFGGDKDRVTIWGACSGGVNVLFHLLSPYSEGLFQRAIIQSAMVNRFVFQELDDVYRYSEWMAAERIGVSPAADGKHRNNIEGLNRVANHPQGMSRFQIPVDDLHHFGEIPSWQNPLYPQVSFGPVVDGKALLGQPFDLISQGRFHKVPLIVGVTSHETAVAIFSGASLKLGLHGVPNSMKDVEKVLHHVMQSSEAVEAVKKFIPLRAFKEKYGSTGNREWMVRVLREILFHGPAQFLTRTWNSNGALAFMYDFSVRILPWMVGQLPVLVAKGARTWQLKNAGAFHVSDVSLAFMLFSDSKSRWAITKDFFSLYMGPAWGGQPRLHWASQLLSTAFTNLAYSGDPNVDRERRPMETHLNFRKLTKNQWFAANGNSEELITSASFLYITAEDSQESNFYARMVSFADGEEGPDAITCSWDLAKWVANVDGLGFNPSWLDNRPVAVRYVRPARPLTALTDSRTSESAASSRQHDG